MSTGSKTIADLEEVEILDEKDQFLFFQNSTKKTKKITRKNLAISRGFGTSISGVVTNDGTPPNVPDGLTVTTATEKDRDGTEKVYIKTSINANTESDLDSYGWSIRRVSGTPVFNGGGNLTGYGGTTQIFDAVTNISPSATGTKMQWDVRSNIWYEVRVCSIDKTGNASSYTSLTSSNVIQSSKDTTAPAAPTSVVATSAIKSVFLSWINPTDVDLAFIKIYRNTTNTPPTIGTTTAYARIMSNSYVDSNTIQGVTYYYWLTSVDFSGNETATTSTVVSIQPGLVANTDITTFAVDATKMFTNTVILKADIWTDNSPSAGYIAWNAHTLVYGGASYSISSGNTNQQFVYWTGGTTYLTSDTNPTLTDGQFMIATNAKNISGNPTGVHDLAWNAIANAVIGSAYIQNAAITNAKVNDLAVDKLTSGSISAQTISLIGDSIIKSSSATSVDAGSGLWIKGLAGGGSEFGIGDLAGTNYGYLKWKTGTSTLEIKGSVKATSGWFGTSDTNGVLVDSSGLEIKGTGATDNIGRIKANIDWTNSPARFTLSTSGFYLGRASNVYRFFIGNTGTDGLGGGQNFLYWDGSALKIGGKIIGGTSIESAPAGVTDGLVINSTIGIRKGDATGTLTITGGAANGISSGAQIDFGGTALSDGNRGILILQGGSAGDSLDNGRIEFRTNTFDGISGVTRGRFNTSGEFIVYKNANSSSQYTGGAGCGQFNGNLSVGRNFLSVNTLNSNDGAFSGYLHVQTEIALYGTGDTQKIILSKDGTNSNEGVITIKNNAGTAKIILSASSGDVLADTFTSSSSKRFKTNIKKLNSGLEIINKLKPVSFNRKGTKQEDIGLIAEEVDKILPVIVKHNDKNEAEGLDYSKLTVILINAVKELSAEVKELKKKLKDANAN